MGTLWTFYFCPGKHVISLALKFFRYNYFCNKIWSIAWGPLLLICAGTEASLKQFSKQKLGSLAWLHPSRECIHTFILDFLGFPQNQTTLTMTWLSLSNSGSMHKCQKSKSHAQRFPWNNLDLSVIYTGLGNLVKRNKI